MGDLKNPKEEFPNSLPPGIRFHPSEHQLLSFYLCNKNKKNPNLSIPSTSKNPIFGLDIIQEIDFYNFDPCDLLEISSFSYGYNGSKKHSYFFTGKVGSEYLKRRGKGGFWKCKGRPRNVMGANGETVLGTKWSFVFYRRNFSDSSKKTNWVMIEYALVDNQKDPFVLCRVFLKSRGEKRAEHVPRSFGEGTITTKNILTDAPYKQLVAPSISTIGEVVAHDDMLVHKDKEIETFPSTLTGELDDVIKAQGVSNGGFGSSMGMPESYQLVKSSDGFTGIANDLFIDSIILEGDFLELNDLICPLVGIDASG